MAVLATHPDPAALSSLTPRLVERLHTYIRLLQEMELDGKARVFSYELAELEGCTAAQVRRDLMTIAYSGSPAKGYDVPGLLETLLTIFKTARTTGTVIVGMGRLGGALAAYFASHASEHRIVATFDVAPARIGRVIHGCHCYAIEELETRLALTPATVGVIATPEDEAQPIADRLVQAGVRGLMNFAPVRLQVPDSVFIDQMDISISLCKVAYFSTTLPAEMEAE